MIKEDVCVYVCLCVQGGLLRANRVLFASQERPKEVRSYLARASAAVSHHLHAPLPGRGRVKGESYDYVSIYVCVCVLAGVPSCQLYAVLIAVT